MTKHIKGILIVIILGLSIPGHSQILMSILFGDKLNSDKLEFGLTLGNNFASISGYEKYGTTKWQYKGWNVGLYFNVKLKDHWYLHLAAIPKSSHGLSVFPTYLTGDSIMDMLYGKYEVERKINYIHVPMLARYKHKIGFFAEAGWDVSLRTKAKDYFVAELDSGVVTYENDIRNVIRRWDVGLIAGVGWKIKKAFEIDFRYCQYFLDIDKVNERNWNSSFMLNFNIVMGANKKDKCADEIAEALAIDNGTPLPVKESKKGKKGKKEKAPKEKKDTTIDTK